ncbi:MAG: hypothetical protein BEN18_02890 [Epulopiscium sp. Nuni2H_MBin001]|nr:MAG: hypothetical protein BEN18_02890 [Epulopiscium sp. Nuni2H_MBin001]
MGAKVILVYALIVYVIGLVIFNPLWWGVGVLCGAIFAIFRLRAIENAVSKAINLDEKSAKSFLERRYFVRYGLTALVLIISAYISIDCLFGVFAGLMGIKVWVYFNIRQYKH